MTDSVERRIKERYPAECLKVELSERGFFGRGRPSVPVSCLDLNRYGMAVFSTRPFETNARLNIRFEGKYIHQPRVAALVVNCHPWRAGFRVSIRFSYCSERRGYSRTVDNALSRIEGFYNRFAS
ncbi:hypothetical protein [Pseudidiomarina gelatinasegens]|uniref:hypothetical protein n=1 Tax=Pseudidiomarina gelatinasegens TaxID=2487740 RepID=UPI003A97F683